MVTESDIIPKADEDDQDQGLLQGDLQFADEAEYKQQDDRVDENDFEEFEDFEEVSIDGSCSTAKPAAAATRRSLPGFEMINVDDVPTGQVELSTPSVIFMCKACQIYFPVRRMLETHMSTVHDDTKKVTVDKWLERNARAGYIKLDDGNYSCRYCDYKAPGRTTVSTHVGRKHGRRRPYVMATLANNKLPPPAEPNKPKTKAKRRNKRPAKAAEPAPSPDDDRLVYVTKVVMTVDDLSSRPEPEDEPTAAEETKAMTATAMETTTTTTTEEALSEEAALVAGHEVPEASNEEEVVEGEVSHVRRMCEYSCPYCRYETRSRADMHAHITGKHNEAWYESVAQREAEREQRKRQDSYNPADGRHHCHHCPFSATSRPTLNAHTRRKHKGAGQPCRSRKTAPVEFHCDQCGFKTMYRHKIQAHIERKHVAEPRYSCEYCARRYKTKSDLTSHMRFQHFHQPLVCEVCGKVCSNSNALHIHKKREHFKPDFECSICKRRMVTQANLDEHVQRQHTDKQHYMCEQCGKVFDQPCKLKQHTMTHTGERPNICHICGKAFARRAVFRQHLLIHSGARPYVCDICGKAFTQKPGLICHRKSHPGDKPPLPVVYIDSILDQFLSKS